LQLGEQVLVRLDRPRRLGDAADGAEAVEEALIPGGVSGIALVAPDDGDTAAATVGRHRRAKGVARADAARAAEAERLAERLPRHRIAGTREGEQVLQCRRLAVLAAEVVVAVDRDHGAVLRRSSFGRSVIAGREKGSSVAEFDKWGRDAVCSVLPVPGDGTPPPYPPPQSGEGRRPILPLP